MTRASRSQVDYRASVSTPGLDDLFDFSKVRRAREAEAEPTPAPVPEPAPRRRRIRDRAALRHLRPAESVPIDPTVSFKAARTAVRRRTLKALESLGVDADVAAPTVVVAPTVAPALPLRWRLLVKSAGEALEFFVGGADVFDAVSRGTPAVAAWMRQNHAGAPWRVEAVEDLAGSVL
jgi:hypothetical protein